jgi:hypothetical protein
MLRRSVAALLSAAAALTGAPLASSAPAREEAIARLLERRAAAVREGDRDAFLATISAVASDAFVARQETFFDRLTVLPVGRYRLTARWDLLGDLARERDRRRYTRATDVAIPLTQERMTFEGFDASPAVEDLYLTFVLHDGRWGIASDTDLEDIGFLSARRIWEFGPVEAGGDERFLLLHHPGAPPRPEVLDLAHQGLARVAAHWGGGWSRRVPVVVPASADELRRMLQITVDPSDFVAFAYSNIDDRDHGFTGTRILLNRDAVASRSSASAAGVIAHELAHAATRSRSGPLVPLWVEEGMAEEVRHGGSRAALAFLAARRATFDRKLPLDVEFQVGETDDLLLAYQEAYSAVRFFIERYGLERFRRFYARLGGKRLVFGTQRYHVDRALRATTGTSLSAFERDWAGSIDAL